MLEGAAAWHGGVRMIRAARRGDTWLLDGTALVVDGEPLLAPVRTSGGWAVADVSAGRVTAESTISPRPMVAVCADGLVVASIDSVEPYMAALAASMAAAARRAIELAAEHARWRVQFGQPIARFQAVQHLAANALMAVETVELVLQVAERQP